MKSKHSGFTLLEFMFAIAILAVIVGIGVPGMRDFVRNSRMSAAANDIVSDFNYARSEAVKRGVPVTLCKSQNGTGCDADDSDPFDRWIVFVDDADAAVVAGNDGNGAVNTGEAILRDRATPDTLDVITLADQIRATFLPNGFPRVENEYVEQFIVCDERGNVVTEGGVSAARAITIAPTGRPQVQRDVATITTLGDCP